MILFGAGCISWEFINKSELECWLLSYVRINIFWITLKK